MMRAGEINPSGLPSREFVKIGFILLSPSEKPESSTRIAALNLFPYLVREGFDPHIVFDPSQRAQMPVLPELAEQLAEAGFRAVVFQKIYGPSVELQALRMREYGIRTVYSVCDHVFLPMVEATDATITVTDYLRSLYPVQLQSRIHVVHDGIEHPEICKTYCGSTHISPRGRLTAVLVTGGVLTHLPAIYRLPHWLSLTVVGRYAPSNEKLQRLREARWLAAKQSLPENFRYLRFLLDRRVTCSAWSPTGVYDHLLAADIGLIPIDPGNIPGADALDASWRVKSENRLTLKMAIGLPVVATPIPAYEQVIEHGVNGFLARTPADWDRCFSALRDPELRRAMGERARASVLERFGQEEQAKRFLHVLRSVLAQPARVGGANAV